MTHEIPLSGYTSPVKRIEFYPEQSAGADYLQLQPDAEWASMASITVSFYRESGIEKITVDDTYLVEVPSAMTAEETTISDIGVIVISGTTTSMQRYSVDIAFTVPPHTAIPGESSPTPTPEEIDQLILLAGQAQLISRGVRDNVVVVSDTQPTSEFNKVWIEDDIDMVEVPDMVDFERLNTKVDNLKTYTDAQIDYVISLISSAYGGDIDLPDAESEEF